MKAVVVLWLLGHPIAVVSLLLAATAALGVVIASTVQPGPAGPGPDAADEGIAEATLPEPTQFPPHERVEEVHRALHTMGRACEQPMSIRDPASVREPVTIMEKFAREYPEGGFRIDDEPGTTMSLLVVLRFELQNCEPSLVESVDDLLPARFRTSS